MNRHPRPVLAPIIMNPMSMHWTANEHPGRVSRRMWLLAMLAVAATAAAGMNGWIMGLSAAIVLTAPRHR